MKSLFSLLLVAASLLAFSPAAHAQEEVPTTTEDAPMTEDTYAEPEAAEGTIGQTLTGDADLSTLATAIEAAGLSDALEADGSFILLAPSNEAFASLPEGVLDALLLPENADALNSILTYHLVDGADEASTTTMQDVLQNQQVTLGENVRASNGVIYTINQVLLPEGLDLDALQGGN